MNEDGMPNVTPQHVTCRLAAVARAIAHVRYVVVAIRPGIGMRIFLKPRPHSAVDIPVGCIHRYMSDAAAVLVQQRAEAVALVGCIAFLINLRWQWKSSSCPR